MTKTKPNARKKENPKKAPLRLSEDHDLASEELSGRSRDESLNVSETDEDENEGIGGGNLERSDDDVFKNK